MNKLFAVFTAICLLVPAACGAETIDRIVAVVNGDVITQSDLDSYAANFQMGSGRSKESLENLRREALDKLIDNIVLKYAIEKAKITVDESDLQRAIQSILQQNKISLEQLKADLAKKGVSFETYKQQIADQIRMIKFMNQVIGQQIKVSDHEVREYYDRNREKFGGSDFASVRDKVYDAVYEEKSHDALNNYLLVQRQKAYIDIRL